MQCNAMQCNTGLVEVNLGVSQRAAPPLAERLVEQARDCGDRAALVGRLIRAIRVRELIGGQHEVEQLAPRAVPVVM